MAKTPTDIRSLARSHTETALNVLAKIMVKEDAPEAARVSAANSLLDRGWGKAPQHITHERIDNLSDEQIRGELESILTVLRGFGVVSEGVVSGGRTGSKGVGKAGPSKPH